MSYLNVPRLHFSGEFLTSPSTINNTPANYITTPTPPYPTYPPDVPANAPGVLWNPMGVAKFMLNGSNVNGTPLSGCIIRSVMPASGDLLTSDNSKDPLIGASVQTSTDDAPAKIVDLDPDQQLATLFIGIRLQLVMKDGTVAFSMKPEEYLPSPNLTDYAGSGGVFESQIKPKQIIWNKKAKSKLFKSFMGACKSGISVKFIIKNYDTDITSETFNFGLIVGALGPAKRGEAIRASVDRKYIPQSANSRYNSGYFQVDTRRKKLVLDFGNSVANYNYSAGKSPDISAALLIRKKPVSLGPPLAYTAQNFMLTAGILELSLTSTQLKQIKSNPLQFYETMHSLTNPRLILSEYISKSRTDFPTGTYITPSQISARLGFDQSKSITLIARRYGKPMDCITLDLGIVTGSPRKGIQFPKTVETLKNGKAIVKLTACPPPLQGERSDIGSQLYFLKGKWQKTSFIGISFWPMNHAALSIKAYAQYDIPDLPTWDDDVAPVMKHFMTLYPGMKAIHDMSNYQVAKSMGNRLASVFSMPMDNPGYMPVTRELNPAIMSMVVKWVNQGMVKSSSS